MAVPAIGELLAEGRKHGIEVRLANQNSAQIPRALWETATANAGAVVSFRTGSQDAIRNTLLYPNLEASQLTTLPDHWAAVTAGGLDLVAPGPAPLPRDDGAALEAGHASSLAETRRALYQAIAEALASGIRTQPRSAVPDDALERRRRYMSLT